MPFWPGGLEEVTKDAVSLQDLDENAKGLKKIPPGFSRGLRLPGDTDEAEDEELAGINMQPRTHPQVTSLWHFLLTQLTLSAQNGDAYHPEDEAQAAIQEQIGSTEIDDLLPTSVCLV